MADSPAKRLNQKPTSRDGESDPQVRIRPPANDNRTGRLTRIAAIAAAAIALLWLLSD